MSSALANTILIAHALFIAFVVGGFLLIVAGMLRRWVWIRNPWFRVLHLLAIGIVALQAWLGKLCPLTVWESRLREAAGGVGYPGSFIRYWVQKLIYYDFPAWVFTLAYTVFGALVLLVWFLAPPRWSRTSQNR